MAAAVRNPSMATLAVKAASVSSQSLGEAQLRSRALLRHALRNATYITHLYALELPISTVRKAITQQWRMHKDVKDVAQLDRLVFIGSQELDETMLNWKQRAHIMRYIDSQKTERTFLDEFYENVDESAVPTAHA